MALRPGGRRPFRWRYDDHRKRTPLLRRRRALFRSGGCSHRQSALALQYRSKHFSISDDLRGGLETVCGHRCGERCFQFCITVASIAQASSLALSSKISVRSTKAKVSTIKKGEQCFHLLLLGAASLQGSRQSFLDLLSTGRPQAPPPPRKPQPA